MSKKYKTNVKKYKIKYKTKFQKNVNRGFGPNFACTSTVFETLVGKVGPSGLFFI